MVALSSGAKSVAQVVMQGLAKSYSQGLLKPRLRAVTGLWLGILPGQCFGLLGTNGAGNMIGANLSTLVI